MRYSESFVRRFAELQIALISVIGLAKVTTQILSHTERFNGDRGHNPDKFYFIIEIEGNGYYSKHEIPIDTRDVMFSENQERWDEMFKSILAEHVAQKKNRYKLFTGGEKT